MSMKVLREAVTGCSDNELASLSVFPDMIRLGPQLVDIDGPCDVLAVSSIFSTRETGSLRLIQSLAGDRDIADSVIPWDASHSLTASRLSG